MNTNSTKTFSWNRAIIVSLVVGLTVMALSISLQSRSEIVQRILSGGYSLVASNPIASTRGAGSSYAIPGKPVRLIIPAIGVDAHIQSVGLSWHDDGTMGVPTNFTDVAWYNKGPLPGEPGSAVIDGHLDGRDTPKAVFYDLGKLKAGDLVEVVDARGTTLRFRVVGTKTYDYNAPTTDVFAGDPSKMRLNLITCAGDWMKAQKIYTQRIVVFTELVPAS